MGKQRALGFTRDISSKGAFILCEPEIPLGSYIHLTILLRANGPGPRITLDVIAKVCRVVRPLTEGETSGLAVQNYRFKLKSRSNASDFLMD